MDDETEKLTALSSFRHAGKELTHGCPFWATPVDARFYIGNGQAEYAKKPTIEFTTPAAAAPVAAPAPEPAPFAPTAPAPLPDELPAVVVDEPVDIPLPDMQAAAELPAADTADTAMASATHEAPEASADEAATAPPSRRRGRPTNAERAAAAAASTGK